MIGWKSSLLRRLYSIESSFVGPRLPAASFNGQKSKYLECLYFLDDILLRLRPLTNCETSSANRMIAARLRTSHNQNHSGIKGRPQLPISYTWMQKLKMASALGINFESDIDYQKIISRCNALTLYAADSPSIRQVLRVLAEKVVIRSKEDLKGEITESQAHSDESTDICEGMVKRKTAVATAKLTDGCGKIQVNGKAIDEYFQLARNLYCLVRPFAVTKTFSMYDTDIQVHGGGYKGNQLYPSSHNIRTVRSLNGCHSSGIG